MPEHLAGPVTDWLNEMLASGSGRFPVRVALHLRFTVDTYEEEGARRQLVTAAAGDPDLCLRAVSTVLALGPDDDLPVRPNEVDDLREILDAGGSAYRVAADGRGLERRVGQSVMAAVAKAARAAGGDAERHLSDGWRAVYGRDPDPRKAYSEAVHAVEAAAIPVVLPSDSDATLGRVIGHMRQHPADWELAIRQRGNAASQITPLLAMMDLLWRGETARHSSGQGTRRESREAAETAIHLAVTLVHWFTSGGVHRAGPST